MELRRYWVVWARWLWLIALTTILAAVTSFLVSRAMTPIYSASALILVDQTQNSVTPDYNSVLTSELLTGTYGQLIQTHPILSKAIADLHLTMTTEELGKAVSTSIVRNTQLLNLTVENPDPALARDLANTLARDFIDAKQQEKLGKSSTAEAVLRQHGADTEAQIKQTTAALDQARANGQGQSNETVQLQAQLSQEQSTYSQLLQALEQMQVDQARVLSQVSIAQPAELPLHPVRPILILNVLLAALAGLLFGVGTAYLAEYLDNTVKTPDDFLKLGGIASLGTISRIPSREGSDTSLLDDGQDRSSHAEAYRILRTNLDFARFNQPGKVLLVTSASASEGKTTTLSNLAVVMAQAGRRIIAVDADLRRPAVHHVFGSSNERGLTNLLLEDDPVLDEWIEQTRWPNLWILPSGPIPPNPSELLASNRMTRVLDLLRNASDVVLLDSPPMLPVADASILAAQADGVILVVDAGRTRVDTLGRVKERLSGGSTRILGAVLNRVRTRAINDYYYYDYRYVPSTPNGKVLEVNGAGHRPPGSAGAALGALRRAIRGRE